ncbi:MAG: tetratricopeptide repeat protein [bacterium]|nr:tetratricopeptide repeat protein [bacterium]
MGLLKIFSSKKPQEYEQKGDELLAAKEYGAAKIEYEAALDRVEKVCPNDEHLKERIRQKLIQAKDSLARLHQQAGQELIEAEAFEQAEERLRLALELAEDPELVVEIEEQLRKIEDQMTEEGDDFPNFDLRRAEDAEDDPDYQERVDEYFTILCSSLPEQLAEAYQSYGDNFKIGYVALNHGDFDLALDKLKQAMEEIPSPSFIPLELAKVYLNLNQYQAAIPLLEALLKAHPDLLSGYQLLCEAYWAVENFDQAQKTLSSLPKELADSLPAQLLRGETLFRAKQYQEAESFYISCMESFGWDENLARGLAITYEALGEKEKALNLYGEIMDECRGCGFRIDPFIKQRYAELWFESGRECSTRILELFLSLVHEDPSNRAHYYKRISQIYAAQGDERQARRYQLFAKKLEGDEQQEPAEPEEAEQKPAGPEEAESKTAHQEQDSASGYTISSSIPAVDGEGGE